MLHLVPGPSHHCPANAPAHAPPVPLGLAAALALALALTLASPAGGCAGVNPSGGGTGKDAAATGSGGSTGAGGGAATDGGAGGALPMKDGPVASERPAITLVAEVFAHSDSQLFVLDPGTKRVTLIGTFDCVGFGTTLGGAMVDIAVDKSGRMTGSAAVADPDPAVGLGGALLSIDKSTAHCQLLTLTHRAPITSLTYVPAGTVSATDEVLVGYDDDVYLRIDPSSGAVGTIGMLNNAQSGGVRWVSSGDVVSITGGGTYLTVTGAAPARDGGVAGDRIVEVNPTTGALTRIIGDTGVPGLLGLGYWAGVAYGFSLDGKLLQIDLTNGAPTPIAIPNADPDLAFYGAGTTTIAPIVP